MFEKLQQIIHNSLKAGDLLMRVFEFFRRRRGIPKKCDICDQKFETLESMEEHRRRVHKDAAPKVENGN